MQVDDSYNMMSTMKLTWFAAKEVQGVQKLFLEIEKASKTLLFTNFVGILMAT